MRDGLRLTVAAIGRGDALTGSLAIETVYRRVSCCYDG